MDISESWRIFLIEKVMRVELNFSSILEKQLKMATSWWDQAMNRATPASKFACKQIFQGKL